VWKQPERSCDLLRRGLHDSEAFAERPKRPCLYVLMRDFGIKPLQNEPQHLRATAPRRRCERDGRVRIRRKRQKGRRLTARLTENRPPPDLGTTAATSERKTSSRFEHQPRPQTVPITAKWKRLAHAGNEPHGLGARQSPRTDALSAWRRDEGFRPT